jgi:hypothetical protein
VVCLQPIDPSIWNYTVDVSGAWCESVSAKLCSNDTCFLHPYLAGCYQRSSSALERWCLVQQRQPMGRTGRPSSHETTTLTHREKLYNHLCVDRPLRWIVEWLWEHHRGLYRRQLTVNFSNFSLEQQER